MTDPMTPLDKAAGVIDAALRGVMYDYRGGLLDGDFWPGHDAIVSAVAQALSDAGLLAPAVGREGWRFDMENAPTGDEQFIGLDNYGAQVWLGEAYHLALSPSATPSMPSVEARAVWAWKPLGPLPTPPEGTPDDR